MGVRVQLSMPHAEVVALRLALAGVLPSGMKPSAVLDAIDALDLGSSDELLSSADVPAAGRFGRRGSIVAAAKAATAAAGVAGAGAAAGAASAAGAAGGAAAVRADGVHAREPPEDRD